MRRFTSEFGMGSGGSNALKSSGKLVWFLALWRGHSTGCKIPNTSALLHPAFTGGIKTCWIGRRSIDARSEYTCVFRRVSDTSCHCSRIALHGADRFGLYGQAARAISTDSLHALQCFHTPPIHVAVFHGPSGDSSSQGDLILRGASRLDAFSGYPVRT